MQTLILKSENKEALDAGMHWMDFVKELGKREISIFDEENIPNDIEMAKKHAIHFKTNQKTMPC